MLVHNGLCGGDCRARGDYQSDICVDSVQVSHFVLFAKYSDQVKEDGMGTACGTYKGEEECV
jgi:hypothetical protein